MLSAPSYRFPLITADSFFHMTWSMCQVWFGSDGIGIRPIGIFLLLVGLCRRQARHPSATILANPVIDPLVLYVRANRRASVLMP